MGKTVQSVISIQRSVRRNATTASSLAFWPFASAALVACCTLFLRLLRLLRTLQLFSGNASGASRHTFPYVPKYTAGQNCQVANNIFGCPGDRGTQQQQGGVRMRRACFRRVRLIESHPNSRSVTQPARCSPPFPRDTAPLIAASAGQQRFGSNLDFEARPSTQRPEATFTQVAPGPKALLRYNSS